MDISKEIDYSCSAKWTIGEFNLPRTEVFILFDVLLVMEDVFYFLERDQLLLIMFIHSNNILDCQIE